MMDAEMVTPWRGKGIKILNFPVKYKGLEMLNDLGIYCLVMLCLGCLGSTPSKEQWRTVRLTEVGD